MARIVEGPVYKRVKCNACEATIEYLPEEVQNAKGRDIDGGMWYEEWVKCPRGQCPGKGVIRSY